MKRRTFLLLVAFASVADGRLKALHEKYGLQYAF